MYLDDLLLDLEKVHGSAPLSPIQQGHCTCTFPNWGLVPWGVSDGHLVL